jgi:glycosyltransferase involved in cell wall biosynthesis
MSARPHVLMIAPLYAAAEGPVPAAGLRARGLARGLAERGYRLTLVVGMGRGQRPFELQDVDIRTAPWLDLDGLATALGLEGGSIFRRRRNRTARLPLLRKVATAVLPPDRYATWIPAGIAVARSAIQSDTLVLSTGAKSSHIVARAVRRRPWIADLNDLWAGDPHRRIRARARDSLDRRLERATLTHADRLITVTEPMRHELTKRFGSKVETIYSGFDPQEFDLSQRRPGIVSADGERAPVEILFGGTLYPTFNLDPLFAGMAAGRDEGWLDDQSLRVRFIGRLTERAEAEAERWRLSQFVETSGVIPRGELLAELVTADALLLPLYDEDPYSLPMRFFDYVGAGRPIVALGPPERVGAQLIREHRLGAVVSNAGDAALTIRSLVERTADLATPTDRDLFTWSRSLDRLESLIEELVRASP